MQLISFYEICIIENPFEVKCEYGTYMQYERTCECLYMRTYIHLQLCAYVHAKIT